jgi:hypothetical protein
MNADTVEACLFATYDERSKVRQWPTDGHSESDADTRHWTTFLISELSSAIQLLLSTRALILENDNTAQQWLVYSHAGTQGILLAHESFGRCDNSGPQATEPPAKPPVAAMPLALQAEGVNPAHSRHWLRHAAADPTMGRPSRCCRPP